MIFKKKRKRNKEPVEIMLKKRIILSKENTQFLGMTLDSRLNLKEHINKLRAEQKNIKYYKGGSRIKWGGYQKTLKSCTVQYV